MDRRTLLAVSAVVLGLLTIPRPALATSFGFGCITQNLAGDCAIGEAQLSVNVSSPAPGQIRFDLNNVGANAAVIAGAYWDNSGSALLGSIASIVNGTGVSFSANGSPPVLPAGASILSPFVVDFRANADPAPPKNGVGPGETLGVIFNLKSGVTPADVIAGMNSGELRVGLHVIAFASGGSESFVNTPVPEPTSALLVGAGTCGLSTLRRRVRG
jgi:hypothetical protein